MTKNAREALIHSVTEELLVIMREQGISRMELAKRLGKSKSYVSQTLSGARNMTLGTLSDICVELNVEPRIVLTDALAEPENQLAARLQRALVDWPGLQVAVLFGSMAQGTAGPDSDLDLAVQMKQPLTAAQKMALIGELANLFGRPVDIVDLREAGQPLLGEIVSKGVMVKGGAREKGDLLFKSIMLQEDFAPYQQRILEGRRRQWIEH